MSQLIRQVRTFFVAAFIGEHDCSIRVFQHFTSVHAKPPLKYCEVPPVALP